LSEECNLGDHPVGIECMESQGSTHHIELSDDDTKNMHLVLFLFAAA
jgi:hypothetical protein